MTAHILIADQIATASEKLQESERNAAQLVDDLKIAKLALKLAEKNFIRAKKTARKASKLEARARKRLDALRRKSKKSKARQGAKPAKVNHAVEPESPPE